MKLRKMKRDLADKADDRQGEPVKGNWPMAKGELAGLCEPLLENHKPRIVRLAHQSSETHHFCLWKVPARKLHLRGRLWKSGSCLDWCPALSGRG